MSNQSILSQLSPDASRLVDGATRADAAGDAKLFASFLAEDVVFRLGFQPQLVGREHVLRSVDGLFQLLDGGVSHEIERAWEVENVVIYEAVANYVRKEDGRRIAIPYSNVLEHDGRFFTRYFIYIDPSALFAP
ncbi:nuclear transport factor 2 family protein [Actinoplanes sp. CA-030573]|uniref:nuclear transport factor 2 family protein n=1 Tax=Actinoplanes sp. CA-030573 TaxID=3239898 RepID=UPI003D89C821